MRSMPRSAAPPTPRGLRWPTSPRSTALWRPTSARTWSTISARCAGWITTPASTSSCSWRGRAAPPERAAGTTISWGALAGPSPRWASPWTWIRLRSCRREAAPGGARQGAAVRPVGGAVPPGGRGARRRSRPATAPALERSGDRVPGGEAGRRAGLRGGGCRGPRRHRHRRAQGDGGRCARAARAGLRPLPAGGGSAGGSVVSEPARRHHTPRRYQVPQPHAPVLRRPRAPGGHRPRGWLGRGRPAAQPLPLDRGSGGHREHAQGERTGRAGDDPRGAGGGGRQPCQSEAQSGPVSRSDAPARRRGQLTANHRGTETRRAPTTIAFLCASVPLWFAVAVFVLLSPVVLLAHQGRRQLDRYPHAPRICFPLPRDVERRPVIG